MTIISEKRVDAAVCQAGQIEALLDAVYEAMDDDLIEDPIAKRVLIGLAKEMAGNLARALRGEGALIAEDGAP